MREESPVSGTVTRDGRKGVLAARRSCRVPVERERCCLDLGGESAAPSSLNSTPATATLSDAVTETLAVPETVAPSAGLANETEGATVSAGGRNCHVRDAHRPLDNRDGIVQCNSHGWGSRLRRHRGRQGHALIYHGCGLTSPATSMATPKYGRHSSREDSSRHAGASEPKRSSDGSRPRGRRP